MGGLFVIVMLAPPAVIAEMPTVVTPQHNDRISGKAETVEFVDMPRGYLAICVGKSTYARCGIIVNVTPIEPEWRGKITLEISNTTPLPAKIYANEGIAQLIFLKGERVCAVSYADKGGKYQDQAGLTLPRVD